GRRGKAWRKVKPVRTYDLVVLGAEWGHGRRRGSLSNLHLGARDPAGGGFLMVGKCFKGLTDEVLRWQTKELLERETGRSGIAATVPAALGHQNPCHSQHACPSDHHTYPWNGLWCTSYADERLPSDTKTVVWDGRTYWCHGQGSAQAGDPDAGSGATCGVERWAVKTLQDPLARRVDFRPRRA